MVHSSRRSGGMRYGLGSSRQRHDDRGGPSSDPAESSEPEGSFEALRDQPEDGRQVAATGLGRRPAHRPEGSALDGAVTGRRGGPSSPFGITRSCRWTTASTYALQATIPHLTRSSLHRCLQRHGISRLPEVDGDKPKRSRFKAYPLGDFPHRSGRGPHGGGPALPVRRHRSHDQVRLRRVA